jgi:hypothetical protein
VSGKETLQIIQMDSEDDRIWHVSSEDSIKHNCPITSILALSEEVLVTYSDGDRCVKMWQFVDQGCKLLKQTNLDESITQLKYHPQSDLIFTMDTKARIGYCEGGVSQKTIPRKEMKEEEEEVDEIDYEQLGMEILEDPDEVQERTNKPLAKMSQTTKKSLAVPETDQIDDEVMEEVKPLLS